jgi:ABC-type Fe3+/spermidine/putrescine transport system ATPase subunit
VADFMGETNFLEGTVREANGQHIKVQTALRTFDAQAGDGWQPQSGERCTLSIRPESWKLGTEATGTNSVPGRIQERFYLGEMAQYLFAANATQTLKIYELNPRFVEQSSERELYADVDPEDVVALPG